MANRIIKESITTSCEIDSLTAEVERFFYRLIVVCDDFGRCDARPQVLRAKCFPLKVDKIKNADMEKWLKRLAEVGLITIYHAEGKPYLQMTTWEKHQQRRAKYSKYPAPEDHLISNDIKCDHMIENVPEESRNRGVEESRNEKGKKFIPPSVEEIKEYCRERKNDINAEQFYDFYTAKNWFVGKNKMKDWRACVRTWEQRRKEEGQKQGEVNPIHKPIRGD